LSHSTIELPLISIDEVGLCLYWL